MNIEIKNLRTRVRLGCTEEERAYPQEVSFDLTLVLSEHRSVMTDALDDTVDYMRVFAEVEEITSSTEFLLVEKLAFDVATAIQEISPAIIDVEVAVRKKVVPTADSMGVTVKLSELRSTLL